MVAFILFVWKKNSYPLYADVLRTRLLISYQWSKCLVRVTTSSKLVTNFYQCTKLSRLSLYSYEPICRKLIVTASWTCCPPYILSAAVVTHDSAETCGNEYLKLYRQISPTSTDQQALFESGMTSNSRLCVTCLISDPEPWILLDRHFISFVFAVSRYAQPARCPPMVGQPSFNAVPRLTERLFCWGRVNKSCAGQRQQPLKGCVITRRGSLDTSATRSLAANWTLKTLNFHKIY